jgi:UDP-N-acetylmuramyl pentapeptide phosphotransferase/UDP-N-acetylglucosamine-1-phosphate transferase
MGNTGTLILGFFSGVVVSYLSLMIGLAIVLSMAKSDGEAKQ